MRRTDAKLEDRRRHVLVSLDVDETIADLQRIAKAAPDARYERELLGTAGDRVDLERVLWRAGAAGGRYEIEYLGLTEVDEAGRSEEHTSELQSRGHLVCRLLLEK